MIVPEGATLKLDPQDEYTHTPEAVSNYNESMYFHAFDKKEPVGAWIRIGNRPNEGYAEVTCCVYLPDKRVGFMFLRPKIAGNKAMKAGGMDFEVIEPFKHLKAAYSGDVLLLINPFDMADPGAAFKANPKVSCNIALDITGLSPMFGGEIVKPDGSPWELDPETAVFRGHTEQHIGAKGRITIGDLSFNVDGFGYRDKSWGPRYWQNFFWYKWLPITFGPDFGIVASIMGRPGEKPFINGNVFAGGILNPIREASVDSEWDENFYQTRLTARLRTDVREYLLEGRIVSLVPLRHRRTLENGRESNARITEGMTEYRCEGHKAYGMSEYLDLIVDNRPISLNKAAWGEA
jgi:hypothetical protein